MSLNKVEEMVETYMNGNTSDFKKWLKRASKKDVVLAVESLSWSYFHAGSKNGQYNYELAITTVLKYL